MTPRKEARICPHDRAAFALGGEAELHSAGTPA